MASGPAATIFKVTEITGDQRVLVLQSRGLPYRGLGFKGRQRAKITWLPGAGIGTATVQGPTEEPTSCHGMWKDIFFGAAAVRSVAPCMLLNGIAITSVKDAVNYWDSVRRLGQLLRVQWAHLIRVGFLTEFEHTWDNEHDVTWNMEFQWVSQGDTPGPVVPSGGTQLADLASAFGQAMDGFDQLNLPRNFGLSNSFLQSMQNLQHSIDNLILNVQGTVINLTDQVLIPIRAARGIMTSLRGIQSDADDLIAYVRSQVSGEMNGSTPIESQRFSEQLEAQAFARELIDWANELRRQAIEQRDALASRTNTDLIAVYTVRQADDLRSISQNFYGTPNEWRRIMVFNDLDSTEVKPGQVLLISSMASASEADMGNS